MHCIVKPSQVHTLMYAARFFGLRLPKALTKYGSMRAEIALKNTVRRAEQHLHAARAN